jgi:glutamyl-tRNA synthetase
VAETAGVTGRFAPSPTGPLHLGNLRTALLAWLLARAGGESFLVRMEDLDRVTSSTEHEARQLAELAAIGLDWDGPVVRQSDRFAAYDAAIGELERRGLTYECFCTRREIREAVQAPHGPEVAYPGTCRELTATERAARRRERPAAVRLRAPGEAITVVDRLAGPYTAVPDDVVLRRNDGVPAYNLAVVVDDAAQGVTEVVRGDDLLASTPRQVLLQRLLGLPEPAYVHVPLVVGADGERLAKRHGAVTLEALAGVPVERVVGALAASLGVIAEPVPVAANELLPMFDLGRVAARGRSAVRLADLQRSWT